MAYMNWDQGYEVGNAMIDDQHRTLVAMINQLHDAMRQGQGAQAMESIFEQLLDYADYHFRAEEALFLAADYADKEAHLAAHAQLLAQAKALHAKFEAGTAFVTIEVLDFMKNWVLGHVLKMDQGYKGLF